MTIIATGIDLAKNVFAVHGVNGGGVVQLRQPKVARGKLGALIAGLPPGMIEGPSSAPSSPPDTPMPMKRRPLSFRAA